MVYTDIHRLLRFSWNSRNNANHEISIESSQTNGIFAKGRRMINIGCKEIIWLRVKTSLERRLIKFVLPLVSCITLCINNKVATTNEHHFQPLRTQMRRAKRKTAFEHAWNLRVHMILRMRKVSSGPLLSSHTFFSIQWFYYRTVKALIRLRGCAGWSGPLLSAYSRWYVFRWRCPKEDHS